MASDDGYGIGCGCLAIAVVAILAISSCSSNDSSGVYQEGDLSNGGGTPTIRYDDYPTYDDYPDTTNDESNDQPLGYYGTDTVYACNEDSGNCYDLDADFSDGEVERLYFPKGGWVDMDWSDDCSGGDCYAEDENGTEWYIEDY